MVLWLRSKATVSEARGVILAEVREGRGTDKPSAYADFDTEVGIGRISVWVSGEVDFEVLRRSDARMVYFGHVTTSTLTGSALDRALDAFLTTMTNPKDDLLTLNEL
ncbi:MAG TPA: hypothetical protein VHE33_19555 [Acidobacteriaceae bacterium]|nr:hypothetical protein [Acidobacteriaceae bacterium]